MEHEQRRAELEEVVRHIGVNGTYQGMKCLVHGADLAYDNPKLLLAVTKELYPEIARRVGGSGKTVERNLRTVVTVCWESGNRALLDELAGFPLRDRPTSGEMIDYLVHYLRRREAERQREGEQTHRPELAGTFRGPV